MQYFQELHQNTILNEPWYLQKNVTRSRLLHLAEKHSLKKNWKEIHSKTRKKVIIKPFSVIIEQINVKLPELILKLILQYASTVALKSHKKVPLTQCDIDPKNDS